IRGAAQLARTRREALPVYAYYFSLIFRRGQADDVAFTGEGHGHHHDPVAAQLELVAHDLAAFDRARLHLDRLEQYFIELGDIDLGWCCPSPVERILGHAARRYPAHATGVAGGVEL